MAKRIQKHIACFITLLLISNSLLAIDMSTKMLASQNAAHIFSSYADDNGDYNAEASASAFKSSASSDSYYSKSSHSSPSKNTKHCNGFGVQKTLDADDTANIEKAKDTPDNCCQKSCEQCATLLPLSLAHNLYTPIAPENDFLTSFNRQKLAGYPLPTIKPPSS